MNKAQSIYKQTINTMRKKYPNYATHGKLTRFYSIGRGLHNRHTQFPNKQRKEKRVATSLCSVANGWPLVSLVSRRHVLSARTCPPRTHTDRKTAPLAPLVHSPARRCLSTLLSLVPQGSGVKAGVTQNSRVLLTRTRSQHVRPRTPLSSHSVFSSHGHRHDLSLRAPPPSGAPLPTLRQSGQRHASFPRHRDRWVFPPVAEVPAAFPRFP